MTENKENLIVDGKEIKSMEDLPEPLQCGSIMSEICYQPNLHPDEDVIAFCKDHNFSQGWIDFVINFRNKMRKKYSDYIKGVDCENN